MGNKADWNLELLGLENIPHIKAQLQLGSHELLLCKNRARIAKSYNSWREARNQKCSIKSLDSLMLATNSTKFFSWNSKWVNSRQVGSPDQGPWVWDSVNQPELLWNGAEGEEAAKGRLLEKYFPRGYNFGSRVLDTVRDTVHGCCPQETDNLAGIPGWWNS